MENGYLVDGFLVEKRWVEETVSKIEGAKARIIGVKVLGGEVLGYMSAIVRVSLQFEDTSKIYPKSVIVKIPCGTVAQQAFSKCTMDEEAVKSDIHSIMHTCEEETYQLFSKTDCSSIAVPKFYGNKSVESGCPALIMEDICDSYTVDLVDGFSEEQIFAIVDELVKFHNWSDTNRAAWKAGTFFENEEDGLAFAGVIHTLAKQLAVKEPKLADSIDVLSRNYLKENTWLTDYSACAKNSDKAVFVHGDLWAPQILWRKNSIAAIVDWALCRAGSIMEDLSRALLTCTKTKIRRSVTEAALRRYANARSMSFEYVEAEYNKCISFSTAMMCFAIPMWSNSSVLRRGGDDDEKRVAEMERRLHEVLEDVIKIHGWK